MRPHPVIAELNQDCIDAGLSVPEAAERLCVAETTLYGWRRGKHEPTSLDDLDRFAALVGKRVALVPIDAEQSGEAS